VLAAGAGGHHRNLAAAGCAGRPLGSRLHDPLAAPPATQKKKEVERRDRKDKKEERGEGEKFVAAG
jgi:hypothetical protein